MAFTAYTDQNLLNHLLGPTAFTKPAALFVALFVGDPSSGGTEISTSGSGYARQSASFTVASGIATNNTDIEWPVATSSWGVISWVAIYDASTGGNQLVTAQLTAAKTISAGDVIRIPASDLDVTLI
jgi:hypothetical protein